MKTFVLLIPVVLSYISANSQAFYPVPAVRDTVQFNKGIARTAWLLASSSRGNRKDVRILVYGQSISEQSWWKDVRDFVKDRFPLANITFVNRAIGGFSSERLKLMAENDVVSFYPDLILFHDYGNEADYEQIIQMIRRRTTAEIALQTDHMAVQGQEWHDKHSQVWLPSMCSKYQLALIDVRSIWKAYLKENNLVIKDLLSDGVHLNAHGNYLMASIMKKYFGALRPAEDSSSYVKYLAAGTEFSVKGNQIELPVNGNRVDLVWKPVVSRNRQVLVYSDEKKPSTLNACYYYTRPAFDNTSFLRKIGQVLAMKLANTAKEEEWAMTFTATDSVKQQMTFSLKGSLTGEDGSGTSESTFVSNSGKITIEPANWFRAKEFAGFPWVKAGEVLKWKVKCMCKDEVQPLATAVTTVLQGIENSQHILKLKGKGVMDLQGIRVYAPALK